MKKNSDTTCCGTWVKRDLPRDYSDLLVGWMETSGKQRHDDSITTESAGSQKNYGMVEEKISERYRKKTLPLNVLKRPATMRFSRLSGKRPVGYDTILLGVVNA